MSAAKGTGQRNDAVEAAVHAALDRIDAFIAGEEVKLPSAALRLDMTAVMV